jgi:hypothetical protein
MVVGQRDGSTTVNMAEPSSLGQLWEGEPRDNRSLQQLSAEKVFPDLHVTQH